MSTCNRVELYAAACSSDTATCVALQQFLAQARDYSEVLNGEIYTLKEPESIEHLFKVACGLDSMVLGETEILGQIRKAYDLALQHKRAGGFVG